jgi:glutamate synthase domain-containing protein 3
MQVELEGYANDAVAEAMSGGVVAVRQPAAVDASVRRRSSVIGNSACYGATGGKLFVEGRAGQRFGVRNSGAVMVCEGAGKYAFEYMTGGIGVVLGPIGPVVGSGMTGGVVWIWSEDGASIEGLLHKDVKLAVATDDELAALRALVEEHAVHTASPRAASLLADWPAAVRRIVKVVPAEESTTPAVTLEPSATNTAAGLVQIRK